MQELYFNSTMICSVTEKEYAQFKLLCPYWGLSLIEEANVILGALSTFMIGVHGLSQKKFKQLSQLLSHTRVSLSDKPEASALLNVSITVDPSHHMPLSVRTDSGDTFYINPLQQDSGMNVQKSVHKHITLKPKKGKLQLTVSGEHEEYICEYLSYIIIQTCIRKEFTSLSNITGEDFSALNDTVLKAINPSFSAIQKRLSHPSEKASETPAFSQQKTAVVTYDDADQWQVAESAASAPRRPEPRSKAVRVHPINPFRQNNVQHSVISPFHASFQKNSEIIRPFQKNKHTPSPESEYSNHTFLTFKKGRGKDE